MRLMKPDPIKEALAILSALKGHIPAAQRTIRATGMSFVDQSFVTHFHATIDRLQAASGFDLSNFRVLRVSERPDAELFYRETLLMEIDTVLGFFQILGPDVKVGLYL